MRSLLILTACIVTILVPIKTHAQSKREIRQRIRQIDDSLDNKLHFAENNNNKKELILYLERIVPEMNRLIKKKTNFHADRKFNYVTSKDNKLKIFQLSTRKQLPCTWLYKLHSYNSANLIAYEADNGIYCDWIFDGYRANNILEQTPEQYSFEYTQIEDITLEDEHNTDKVYIAHYHNQNKRVTTKGVRGLIYKNGQLKAYPLYDVGQDRMQNSVQLTYEDIGDPDASFNTVSLVLDTALLTMTFRIDSGSRILLPTIGYTKDIGNTYNSRIRGVKVYTQGASHIFTHRKLRSTFIAGFESPIENGILNKITKNIDNQLSSILYEQSQNRTSDSVDEIENFILDRVVVNDQSIIKLDLQESRLNGLNYISSIDNNIRIYFWKRQFDTQVKNVVVYYFEDSLYYSTLNATKGYQYLSIDSIATQEKGKVYVIGYCDTLSNDSLYSLGIQAYSLKGHVLTQTSFFDIGKYEVLHTNHWDYKPSGKYKLLPKVEIDRSKSKITLCAHVEIHTNHPYSGDIGVLLLNFYEFNGNKFILKQKI